MRLVECEFYKCDNEGCDHIKEHAVSTSCESGICTIKDNTVSCISILKEKGNLEYTINKEVRKLND